MIRTVALLLFVLFKSPLFGQPVQTVRGTVTDITTGLPLHAATVRIQHIATGTSTDSSGNFTLQNVAVGRYTMEVSAIGYEPAIIKEVQVTSGKELVLHVAMKESITYLDEVTVRPRVNKESPLNPASTVSTRMLSVEEAQRYAGGFDDPARLVSAFAGVSGNVGSNAIIVRGNSPQSLQWKMEGIEIPSPNHLSDMRAFGGGTVTALSTQLLANSDFFSGAMPAEYSNALSGVFDIYMREGNNHKHEHTLQAGVVGIDAASEGPLKKGGRSSYLFNYRYSTLALVAPLLAENAGGIKYQDLSFKLNFPSKKAGTLSLWGIGLKDRVGADAKPDISQWVYDDDRENHLVKSYMGAAGITHLINLNRKQYLKSTLALTVNGIDYPTQRVDSSMAVFPKNALNNNYLNTVLSSFINTKFNAKYSNKTGFTITNMHYNLHVQDAFSIGGPLQDIAYEKGNSTLMSAYTNQTMDLNELTTVNAGINAQFFTLNHRYSIEPRVGIRYSMISGQSLAFAYGLHSRLERLNYYFIKNEQGNSINEKLGFTKAHHFVLGYDVSTSALTHLKIEAYYQYLFDVPVIPDSSFSLLNQLDDWFFNGKLQNNGNGRNYGLDITFERSLNQGYYYLATASIFSSRYSGGDRIWRNTRYNRNYSFNALIGKEWVVGRQRQNTLGLNARLSYQGGDHYSPINTTLSASSQTVVFDESDAFSLQYPSSLTTHLTASYKMNGKKASHEIALKILNLTQYKEYVGFRYNYQTRNVDENREPVVIPNLSYRIDF